MSDPEVCMRRLLALETPEDRRLIIEELERSEPNWRDDWAGAFGRAARRVFKDEA
jgi:hypothetical protein